MNKQEEMKNFYQLVRDKFEADAQQAEKIYEGMGWGKDDEVYCFHQVYWNT